MARILYWFPHENILYVCSGNLNVKEDRWAVCVWHIYMSRADTILRTGRDVYLLWPPQTHISVFTCPGHDIKLHPHFIVCGSFLYCCVMRPASQRFFIHNYIHLRILFISNLVTFFGTNSLSVLMCRKAVNQSINQSINQSQFSQLMHQSEV